MDIQNQFYNAIKSSDIEKIKLFLNNKELDPTANNNFAIYRAVAFRNIEVIKILLNDKDVDPSDNYNFSIQIAFAKEYFNIVNLLWKDQRIKNSLEKDNKELYNKLIFQDNIENF